LVDNAPAGRQSENHLHRSFRFSIAIIPTRDVRIAARALVLLGIAGH
jgi:hypothetical protein